MEIRLNKQPRKYLARLDEPTRNKLFKALERLARLEGDIVAIKGKTDRYRLKIEHYRITFDWLKGDIIITVIEINTRSNIKY